MTADDTDLQLLLCDAGDRSPVLPDGLNESALLAARAPERVPAGRDSMHLEALDRDPNDLPAQRWAVIAAQGEAGDAAIEAIRELIAWREDQQGAPAMIYRVPAEMDAEASLRWKHDVLRAEAVAADERPRYLLILGDLDRVSLELQHTLANGSLVGRLHCPTIRGYRSYAEKVVGRERAAAARKARALFYTVQDGSTAVGTGHRHLIDPCIRMTRDLADRGQLDLEGPIEIPYSDWGPDEMLGSAAVDAPSLLFSLSHGLGAPRRGWRSLDEQHALQGALAMGSESPLSADMVRDSPFLPGGVWMCVACFGAGTPASSAFYPWLMRVAEHGGDAAKATMVLRALPKPGERPFVAALPQALLANPAGPLAVIGHMDLAWTFGFMDPSGKKSRASRMQAAVRAVLGGSRVGVGLDALMHAYRETNDELMSRYQLQRDAGARGLDDPTAPRLLADLWMQRNDLRGYVLLGDPATRLALPGESRPTANRPAANRPAAKLMITAAEPPAPPPAPSQPPGPHADPPASMAFTATADDRPSASLRERAALAMIRGDESPRAIAARLGLSLDEVFECLDVYRAGGRRALGG